MASETLHSFEADFCFFFLCDNHISVESSNCPCCLSWVPEQSIYDGREASVPREREREASSALPFPHGLFKKVSLNFLHVVLLGCTKYWQCFIISNKSLLCALVFIVLPLIIVNSLSVSTQIRWVIPKTVLFMKLSMY